MCLVSFSKDKKYTSTEKIDKFSGTPKWGYIDITSKCSHGCAWCYGGFNEELTSEMSLHDFKSILAKLKVMGLHQITISGGEPTEHPQFLEMVAEATKDFMVHICSHGDWTKDWAKDLEKLGVSQIQFNYQGSKRHDGIHKVLGSYMKQVTAIKQSINAGLETVGTVTVGAYNLKDVDSIFKELSDFGVTRLRVWETVGKGNKWRKGKEAKEIFELCQESAFKLGYLHTQSYDPEFKADSFVSCPAMSEMLMYINSDSELRFCTAIDLPIASFKEDTYQVIQNKYSKFMKDVSSKGSRCVAREE
jgi:MoaA/NifB/PqqE/SkfB family radical SAM enzyme